MKATRRADGTAARKSHDTGTVAKLKSSTTLGASRTAANAVAKTPRDSRRRPDGPGTCVGQARKIESAVNAPRTSSIATTSATRPGQESW